MPALDWPCADVRIVELDVSPNFCPVFDPLKFSFKFHVSESAAPLKDVCWRFKFIFDIVFEKHEVEIGSSRPLSFDAGSHVFECAFPALKRPKGLSDETLNNAACIAMALVRPSGDVVAEAMLVVKVSDSDDNLGSFTRAVFNPLVSS